MDGNFIFNKVIEMCDFAQLSRVRNAVCRLPRHIHSGFKKAGCQRREGWTMEKMRSGA